MTPTQYATAIKALGLSQRGAAKVFGVDERTSRKWIAGDSRVPEPVAKLLRVMIKHKIKPDELMIVHTNVK
jgi:DNA-binding transcriptional regulator YiaG